jgi:pimeloyl-ACP methyl ester carboxylesterase
VPGSHGEGEPPAAPSREAWTVLLLHGFPDIATTFAPLIRPLSEAGYRCVAPWQRGYHPTGTGGFTDEGTLLADALGLIDALELGSVHVVGHDWGADMAYGLSAARPAQVAASVAMAVPHTRPFRRNRRGDFDQLRRFFYVWLFQIGDMAERTLPIEDWAFVRRLWREWSPGWEPPPQHVDEVVRTLAMPGVLETALGYYRALFDAARVDPSRAALLRAVEEDDIQVPTLLLMGERDGCISPQMAAGGEDVFVGPYRVDVLEGCGHFLHLERPDDVARRILAWFTDHPAPLVGKPVASATGEE